MSLADLAQEKSELALEKDELVQKNNELAIQLIRMKIVVRGLRRKKPPSNEGKSFYLYS